MGESARRIQRGCHTSASFFLLVLAGLRYYEGDLGEGLQYLMLSWLTSLTRPKP